MFRSIKWRLTAVFFAVTAVFLFLLGLYLMNSMESYSYDNTRTKMLSNARLMANDTREAFGRPAAGFFEGYAKEVGQDIKARVTIIDTEGKVLGDSLLDNDRMVNHADRPEIAKALRGETGEAIRYSGSLKVRMLYVAVPVLSDDNKVIGAIRVALPWSEIEDAQNRIRLIIGTSILVSLLLMVIVVTSFTTELVVPLREMTRAAQKMAEGKLDTTLNFTSHDEIGSLGRGLNYMARRLRETIGQITEERNKIKAILTSMNDGLIAVDRNSCILMINPAVERMFNVDAEAIVGRSLIEVVRNYDLEKLLQKALAIEESFVQELQIFAPDPKTFRISTAPLTSESGMVGVVAVMRDVTAFREVERMKADFVANVSHELRTPLTSIKGFVETLLDGALDDPVTAKHFLEIINDETDRLNRLINDLLSLSRVEAKQLELHKVLIDPVKLIGNIVSVLSPQAREKEQTLSVNFREPLPLIEADEDMIGQVVINLIDNAIKYTPPGGRIDISAGGAGDEVKITVADTGIGIPRASLPRLFERFYRVDKARSREMGGTGLGLAIVKHILEVHGGRIEVDSSIGQGSTFTFYLPARKAGGIS